MKASFPVGADLHPAKWVASVKRQSRSRDRRSAVGRPGFPPSATRTRDRFAASQPPSAAFVLRFLDQPAAFVLRSAVSGLQPVPFAFRSVVSELRSRDRLVRSAAVEPLFPSLGLHRDLRV